MAVQLSRCETEYSSQFPVAMTKRFHLFPYRTQKLSSSVPMVLDWQRSGRVGRRRIPINSVVKTTEFFSWNPAVFEDIEYWYKR